MPTKTNNKWGRWYLDESYPLSLNIKFVSWDEYWIDLRTCRSEQSRVLWVEHMAEKDNIISEQDIIDLGLAFVDLVEAKII